MFRNENDLSGTVSKYKSEVYTSKNVYWSSFNCTSLGINIVRVTVKIGEALPRVSNRITDIINNHMHIPVHEWPTCSGIR